MQILRRVSLHTAVLPRADADSHAPTRGSARQSAGMCVDALDGHALMRNFLIFSHFDAKFWC